MIYIVLAKVRQQPKAPEQAQPSAPPPEPAWTATDPKTITAALTPEPPPPAPPPPPPVTNPAPAPASAAAPPATGLQVGMRYFTEEDRQRERVAELMTNPAAMAAMNQRKQRRQELEADLLRQWQQWLFSQPLAPPEPDQETPDGRRKVSKEFMAEYRRTAPPDAWLLRETHDQRVQQITWYGGELPPKPTP